MMTLILVSFGILTGTLCLHTLFPCPSSTISKTLFHSLSNFSSLNFFIIKYFDFKFIYLNIFFAIMMESMYYTQSMEQTDTSNVTVDKFMAQFDNGITRNFSSTMNLWISCFLALQQQPPNIIVSTITGTIDFLQQHPFPEVLNRVFNALARGWWIISF